LVSLILRRTASCRRTHEPCHVAQRLPTPGMFMLKDGGMWGMLRKSRR